MKKKLVTKFNDKSSGLDWIIKSLKEYPNGMSENQLNTKHDPVMINQLLNTLVERGVIDLHINNELVGSARRIFKMTGLEQ